MMQQQQQQQNMDQLKTQISFTNELVSRQHSIGPSINARDSQEFGGKRIGGKGGARIKVAVRIRPLLDSETSNGHQSNCVNAQE